ncbi:hypothetical protein [Roseovarius nanhaiticus]|nr:hypothetical protein [Roseovarius nanhaiticus]
MRWKVGHMIRAAFLSLGFLGITGALIAVQPTSNLGSQAAEEPAAEGMTVPNNLITATGRVDSQALTRSAALLVGQRITPPKS